MTPPRLIPLLAQFDFGCRRLVERMTGPAVDSGSGSLAEVAAMNDEEYFWEPVGNCSPRLTPAPLLAHRALTSADAAALDQVGRSTYPNGSDPDDPFLDTAWWVNQELLHHGAEIALLRDLYRDR